jgi:hypothetical protein
MPKKYNTTILSGVLSIDTVILHVFMCMVSHPVGITQIMGV